MKASELIEKLQKQIEQYGDHDVVDSYYDDLSVVNYEEWNNQEMFVIE